MKTASFCVKRKEIRYGKVSISTWGGLSKARLKVITAESSDVLKGKVIVDKDGNPLTGTIELKGGQTVTPGTATQTIACSGKYMTGDISVKGDANLVAGNILSGKSIFGVAGNVRKFGNTTFASAPSGTRKTYTYYPSNSTSLYPLNLGLGFHPVTYGYVCYNNPSYCGAMDAYGTFRVWCGGSRMYDIVINSAIVNGTNLYLPCGTSSYTMDGCAAGYY